jgi:uncharacterized membrane-anchored protein
MGTAGRRGIRLSLLAALSTCLWLIGGPEAVGQDMKARLDKVRWQQGPAIANLGTIAQVRLPEGYVFAGGDDTRLLMEAMHNPPNGQELGFIAPTSTDWYVVFEFDEVGYVKDDEKNSLDADAMLKSIKAGNEAANKAREKKGWPAMAILGWEVPPRYNAETHNLEWAIRGQGSGEPVVNHNTRLLGRKGVMKVVLVTEPTKLAETMPHFDTLVANFEFKPGSRYAEWRQGDKIAEYGLTALVVGGAAAVAVKSGILKSLWKLIVVASVGVAAFLKRLLGGQAKA